MGPLYFRLEVPGVLTLFPVIIFIYLSIVSVTTLENFLIVSAGFVALVVSHCLNNDVSFVQRDALVAVEKDVNVYFL